MPVIFIPLAIVLILITMVLLDYHNDPKVVRSTGYRTGCTMGSLQRAIFGLLLASAAVVSLVLWVVIATTPGYSSVEIWTYIGLFYLAVLVVRLAIRGRRAFY